MCNKSKKKILNLLVKLGIGVSTMLLAGFSLQATQAAAQAIAAGSSDAAVLAAIHRALPGAVSAHTGRGVASVQGQSMLSGGPARPVNMSDLPQATYLGKAGKAEHDRPLTGLTEEEYQALKRIVGKREAAGEIGAFPSLSLPLARPAENPSSVQRRNFFYGQSQGCSLCFPSDMALAVSENFVLQMVNDYVAVYDKHGNLQPGFPKDADTFFGLPSGTYTTDPRAFYDWDSHRFFVLQLTETNTSDPHGPPNVGAIAWAVSQTPDPTQGWYMYPNNLQRASGVCPDFPTLGQDTTNWGTGATQGGIYIGLNLWSGANDCRDDTFTGNVIFILPKNPIYSGAAYGVAEFDNLAIGGILVDTLQPDNVTDRADKPSSIFWTQSFNYQWGGVMCNEGCNGLGIWDISGPTTGTACKGAKAGCPNNPFWFLQGGDGPVVTQETISTIHNYSLPPNAGAPNCKAGMDACIDTNRTYISGGIKYHAGELFGSFNTGVMTNPPVAGPIWFDIHPVTDNNGQLTAVEERQEDCFLCGGWANNGSAYYATLQPDQENNVIMVFDYSDDADYPGTVYTSRRVTYGDSLMDGPGNYLLNGTGAVSGRWGDYSATAPDFSIASQGLLWFSSQYSIYNKGTSYWGTVIGAAEYSKSSDQ